jgi:5S rRNA maturation endonuclease (ribonuclease M5)
VIIDRQVGSNPHGRVKYLLYGTKGNRDPNSVEILDGNSELFVKLASQNPYKVKTYNFLISFAESREELEAKLREKGKTIEELYQEVLSYLLPPEYYPREGLNILAVGHMDTDNFHIHLTVENYDHLNQKSLYIPANRTEIEYYRALEKYIKIRYGLSFGVARMRNLGRAGLEKIKQILEERGTYKNKTRDEVKEEITNYLTELVLSGEIENRDELISYLQAIDGLEIKRVGKSYISFEYAGQRYRLKGGIYDERRFGEIKERLAGKEPDYKELAELFETLRRKREESIKKRRKGIRRGAPLQRLESLDIRDDLSPAGEVEELRREPQASNLDTAFPLDWLTADRNRSSLSPDRELPAGSSTKLRGSGEPDGGKVESLRATGRGNVQYQRSVAELSDYSYPSQRLREIKKVREELREIRKLEIELLKELDPEEVLSALGIEYKRMNGYLLMHSPIREGDEHPSFTAFYGTGVGYWVYKDHATGWSGSSIDLWKAVRNVDYVTAVREMRETFGISFYDNSSNLELVKKGVSELLKKERDRQKEKRRELSSDKEFAEKLAFKVLEITNEITDPELLAYLRKRGIKRIPSWLKQVRYSHIATRKEHRGLAVENVSGALNVRTPQGKYVIFTEPTQSQTFSLIRRAPNNRKLVVVEGLFDALSIEQIAPKRDYDILILNSVNNLSRTLQNGVYEAYNTVIMALDNDPKGSDTMELLKKALRGKYELKRLIYEGKDLNEWLVKYSRRSPITVEVLSSRPYLAGILRAGEEYIDYGKTTATYELVITDNPQVLDRVGQEKELLKVVEILTPEEISTLWSKVRFRGAPRVITKDGKAPEWILEGLRSAKRREKHYAPYLTSKFEIVEVSPPEPKLEKYWTIDGKVVLREDVENSPELYLWSGLEEVRQIAEEALERERRRLETLEEDYGPSMGI